MLHVGYPGQPGRNLAALSEHQRCFAVQPAEVVVRRAGAFGGDHARPDGRLRCAGSAEHLALPWLDDALEHLAALACLRIRHPHAGHVELVLRVELGVVAVHLQRALRYESQVHAIRNAAAIRTSRTST